LLGGGVSRGGVGVGGGWGVGGFCWVGLGNTCLMRFSGLDCLRSGGFIVWAEFADCWLVVVE